MLRGPQCERNLLKTMIIDTRCGRVAGVARRPIGPPTMSRTLAATSPGTHTARDAFIAFCHNIENLYAPQYLRHGYNK